MFSTQESNYTQGTENKIIDDTSADFGTQSFSIMDSVGTNLKKFNFNSPDKFSVDFGTPSQESVSMKYCLNFLHYKHNSYLYTAVAE